MGNNPSQEDEKSFNDDLDRMKTKEERRKNNTDDSADMEEVKEITSKIGTQGEVVQKNEEKYRPISIFLDESDECTESLDTTESFNIDEDDDYEEISNDDPFDISQLPELDQKIVKEWSQRPFEVNCFFDHYIFNKSYIKLKFLIETHEKLKLFRESSLKEFELPLEALLQIPSFLSNESNINIFKGYIKSKKSLRSSIKSMYSEWIKNKFGETLLSKLGLIGE